MNYSEFETRTNRVDVELAQAGWSASRRNLIEEYVLRANAFDAKNGVGQLADYVLLDADGKPLAVVEAKRSSRDALAGKRQALDYADVIARKFDFDPFIFLTNGRDIWFWDRKRYPERKVSGFYTRDDLERLPSAPFRNTAFMQTINADIAGRDYQNEAIRQVTEGVDTAKRKFLLVMATGRARPDDDRSGRHLAARQTRTARAVLGRPARIGAAGHVGIQVPPAQRKPGPHRSWTTSGARIQFSTYPSMMQVYSRLSVGYYDLIVADESHRSIYQRYKAIFDHFDAIQLGLTATPTDYIDHNTFELFDCGDGAPSYYYSYEQAIADQNLVNYRVLDAQTNFQSKAFRASVARPP